MHCRRAIPSPRGREKRGGLQSAGTETAGGGEHVPPMPGARSTTRSGPILRACPRRPCRALNLHLPVCRNQPDQCDKINSVRQGYFQGTWEPGLKNWRNERLREERCKRTSMPRLYTSLQCTTRGRFCRDCPRGPAARARNESQRGPYTTWSGFQRSPGIGLWPGQTRSSRCALVSRPVRGPCGPWEQSESFY